MRKIFCLLILTAALIIGGCTASKMSVETTDNEVKISATNSSDGGSVAQIKIPDGAALHVDAKITAGKLIIDLGDRKQTVDKTGEFFIDVPVGSHDLFLSAEDGLTGEITLRALPRL